jgi:hypothetical protein
VVPPDQVEPLRQAILTYLHASHLSLYDRARAEQEFAAARALENRLERPAATLMSYVNDRAVGRLGPLLLPHLAGLGEHPALSPSRSPPPAAPVYLLHGSEDNVIPASETWLLARELERATDVRTLVTPLISHAEAIRGAPGLEEWRLVQFWEALLSE